MSGIGGAIGSIFGGIGSLFSASAYDKAAHYAGQNAQYVKMSTAIQEEQQTRKAYELVGTTTAAAGANSLSLSGSAIDVLHSNAQQITLNKSLTALQGQIDVNAWLEKQQMDKAAGQASTAGGIGGIIGGILQIGAEIASAA